MESILGIILVLSIAGLLTPALEVVWKRFTSKYLAPYIASIALVLALIINLYSILQPGEIPYIFGNVLMIDSLGLFFSIVVILVALLVGIASIRYIKDDPNRTAYYTLLLFTALDSDLCSDWIKKK
jgi:formate hydrogenlyase subunit 3/multisubunit Na+/H+ antiporter MnhD subunit